MSALVACVILAIVYAAALFLWRPEDAQPLGREDSGTFTVEDDGMFSRSGYFRGGEYVVGYPSLDIWSSGETVQEAQDAAHELLGDYLQNRLPRSRWP